MSSITPCCDLSILNDKVMAGATAKASRVPIYRQVPKGKLRLDTASDASKLDLIAQATPETPALVPVSSSQTRLLYRAMQCLCVCLRPAQPRVYAAALPQVEAIIPPQSLSSRGKKTLVLDLDETLVHSTFKRIESPDVYLEVTVEDRLVPIYVRCRPGLIQLLEAAYRHYELVVFTASMEKYANPLLDILDPSGLVEARLFREHCQRVGSGYVKDLRTLGRDLSQVILVDVKLIQNSPDSYTLQPENAIPIRTYIDDEHDTELMKLIPLLESLAKESDVRQALQRLNLSPNSLLPEVATQREENGMAEVTDGTQDDLRLDLNSPRKM